MSSLPKTAVRLRTYSKVNLFLRVLGRRSDGYHEIETIMHGVGLGDELTVELTRTGRIEIEMELDEVVGDIPLPESNAIWHAAERLVERGAVNEGIRVTVVKRIPISAGLGGGSGNAAGALHALNELWELGLERSDLLVAAAKVGSDVPFCIDGGTVLATSRGEELTHLPVATTMWFVLGMMNEPLLTKDIYGLFDAERPDLNLAEITSASVAVALGSGDVREIASLVHNDLERIVFEVRPSLRAKKEALLAAGALGASVSGSGPTMYGIAQDEDHAHRIADVVGAEFDRCVVVASVPECIERLD